MEGKLTKLDKIRINNRRKQILKTDTEKERILSQTQTATLLDYIKWIGDFDFDTMPDRHGMDSIAVDAIGHGFAPAGPARFIIAHPQGKWNAPGGKKPFLPPAAPGFHALAA